MDVGTEHRASTAGREARGRAGQETRADPGRARHGCDRDRTSCAIVGGGPAGIVLGLLLARYGIEVTVLEKHADFLRDFRGDTVHPGTLGLLDDLGLFDRFDALAHSRMTRASFPTPDGGGLTVVDFHRLPVRHPYVAMVPQWDLLSLLAGAAEREPTFTLLLEHEVTDVLREGDRVTGVEYAAPEGPGRLAADLVVACDGRWSTVRRALDLPVREAPVGFDVWWFRLPTRSSVGQSLLPRVARGRAVIAIPRNGYLQVAYLGLKGEASAIRARGVHAFRDEIASLLPEAAGDVGAIAAMDDVKHLDVRVDRLRRWHRPGALCIGDAAHAMSPVGGVGVNLAIQDAVAAARILARPLADGSIARTGGEEHLARVQRRRMPPAVLIQAVQRALHRAVIVPTLRGRLSGPPRALLVLARRLPWMTVIPAAILGIGPRPERAPGWARRAPLR